MAEIVPVPLSFEGGLADRPPATMLNEGEASALQGWEPFAGGLVPQPGWKHPSQSGLPGAGDRQGRGIHTKFHISGARKIVAGFYDGSTTISLRHAPATPETSMAWTTIEDVTITSPYEKLPVGFAVGNEHILYTNPGFPSERIRKYDGTTASAIATDDIAGRFLAYHLNRFWTGGAAVNPTFLRFSEIGDEDNWNTSENFIPIGREDQEPIEDGVVFDRGIVLVKRHSLWWLAGTGPDSFQLLPISQRVGSWPGRSLVVTPVGIIFPSMNGEVMLWDGADVRTISERRHIISADGGTDEYVSCEFSADRVYLAYSDGTDTRKLQVYDIRRGISWERHHQDANNDGPRDLATVDHYLIATAYNPDESIGIMALQDVGRLDTASFRDPSPDAVEGTAYIAQTAVAYPAEGLGRATLRSVYLRYRQWETDGGTGFVVTPVVDGTEITAQAKTFGDKAAAGVYTEREDFGALPSGNNIALKFTQTASASVSAYSIEQGWAYVNIGEGRR